MDEVSSHFRLDPTVSLTARPTIRLFHLVFETHYGRALVPSPKRSASPRATSILQRWIVWKCLTQNGRLEKRKWSIIWLVCEANAFGEPKVD